MPFDISEIKKLPTEEKLRIIDELWESIDDEEKYEEESPEVIALIEERLAKYERGEGKFYTEEELRMMLANKLEEIKNDKLRKSKG
jgi:putative addiction module component (TIGR02574 family)